MSTTLYLSRFLIPITAPPVEDGAVLVRNGRLAAIGRRKDVFDLASGAEIVDFGDSVLLPPFVNAHTHLELTHFPLWAEELERSGEPRSFIDWLLRMIGIKRQIAPERFAASISEGIGQSLRSGTGAVGDILSWLTGRSFYDGSPLKGRIFLEFLGRDVSAGRARLEELDGILQEGRAGEMTLALSPHSLYTLSQECLEEVFGFARDHRTPISIHLAESLEEIHFLRESGGPLAEILYPHVGWGSDVPSPANRSPVDYLENHGGLSSRTLVVHGVHVAEDEAVRLARSGCTVVLCPRSNARLGVGLPPLAMYRKAGVQVALGTDSLASNDSLSIWDEIAFAREKLSGADPRFLLKTATCGGTRALGLAKEAGMLKVSGAADFQVLTPLASPSLGDLEEYLCAPGRTAEVTALFLEGRDVLADR